MIRAQRNSFVTIAEQVQLLNNNAVSLLTSMNNIVTSEDSSVNVVQLDNQGNETTFSLPTVGKLQSDINIINNNIRRLSGLNDNTVHVIEGNSTKKIYLTDLSREPNRIDRLNTVSNFTAKNNWFFESLMNPMLTVNFDLTDKVERDVDGIISRRYIVRFEKDENGEYTQRGEAARTEFVNTFVNRTDINLSDFLDWLTNPTNTGVIRNTTPVFDEEIFEFEYQEIEYQGLYSVMSQEIDSVNNKLWYHVYPNIYTNRDGEEFVLKVNDELILNRQDSVTRWVIVETSTASSEFRIRLKRVEGYDPVPTGANVLKFYGGKLVDNNIKVSIGFDEHLVIFAKPVNSKSKIKGSVWSRGTGLYTNDLVLDTDDNVSMSQFYVDTVYDYGLLLKDMIQKEIPSKYAAIPNIPSLLEENFKVVQINRHLTDTPDSKQLKDLHSQKITTKTKLEQVNSAISQKNRELSVRRFPSLAERNKSQNELTKLTQEQESLSKLLVSVTNQMKSSKDTVSKSDAKFRIRGFWDIPQPVQERGYRPQEVVQFIIQYRYSSKAGTENQTEGFNLDSLTARTGYFSNWVEVHSGLRKRKYDKINEKWTWETEDISDADIPNINQLDIPISPQEKVEIRVKSISEVGYPESQITSDWSETITIDFPDDLNNVLDENEFIIEEAEQDNMSIMFEEKLNAKGINRHVAESFTVNENYFAHKDNSIETIFKDNEGNPFSLQEYLQFLTDKIQTLENIVYSARGVLKVSIFNGADEIEVKNRSTVDIDVNCQNYASTNDGVVYENKLYIIKDFYLKLENLSVSSVLSFLVNDSYITGTTVRRNNEEDLTSLVDIDNDFVIQENGQYIYFCDKADNTSLYEGAINYDSATVLLRNFLELTDKIAGLSKDYINKGRQGNESGDAYSALGQVDGGGNNDWDMVPGESFSTLVCPQINSIDDLIVDAFDRKNITNQEIVTIPINIYWKFKGNNSPLIDLQNESYIEHNKTLRVRLHPSSTEGVFDFRLRFNIKNKNI